MWYGRIAAIVVGALNVTDTVGAVPRPRAESATPRIDCDAHNLPMLDDMTPHMSERWRRYLETFGVRTPTEMGIVRPRWMGARSDSWSPDGRAPGNDPEFMLHQLVDRYDLDCVILNNVVMQVQAYNGGNQPQELTNAIMHAANAWTAESWLALDDRYYASICVPCEDAASALAELERWVDNDRFVQVLLPFRMARPLGHRKYRPLLRALAELGMPLAMHPGNAGNLLLSGAGWPSYYYEDHNNLPQALPTHMASLVCEGVFEELPELKVVALETGWSWVSPFLWRLDRTWRQLEDEVPEVRRPPSESIREHFWFATQPMEEPFRREQFAEIIEVFGQPDRLMFSSDYPHWDFDAPDEALPATVDDELRSAIIGGNAHALYWGASTEASDG